MSALPDWCEPLPDARRMQAVDRWAIEQGVPSPQLMERAGAGVAHAVERIAPDGPVAVVCGKGNNGGDGLVAARLLGSTARRVTAVLTAPVEELSADARANLERLANVDVAQLGEETAQIAISGAAVIVDALLGTGFQGAPRGGVADAIQAILRAGAPVVSVDVPSGVDASTGAVAGVAVRATLTVTFHVAKPGLWVHPGKEHVGELSTVDIGIPRGAPLDADIGLMGPAVLDRLARRTARSTKFTSGHVIVVGGSPGLMGAPAMACLAAARTGAGYVTACVPRSLREIIDVQLMEVMSRGLPEQDGSLTPEAVAPVVEALARGGALVLGPGLGRDQPAQAHARDLARVAGVAMVLDADGLNAFAGRLGDLAERTVASVLTPHAGELARLIEMSVEEVQGERLRAVRMAAQIARAVVVLKGDDTLIAEPGGMVAVSPGDSPALATAGTGDVLSGAIAALLSQGVDPFAAAAGGVWLHVQAGRIAAQRQGAAEGVIATDVIAALPAAWKSART